MPQAEHNLYRPQDKAQVDFKALDANDQPVQTEGTVKVTRDYWYEIWISPDGKEVKGDELKALRNKSTIWPPAPEQSGSNPAGGSNSAATSTTTFSRARSRRTRTAWRNSASRRSATVIIASPGRAKTRFAKRNVQAAIRFKPRPRSGFASGKTTELGYRHGGVQIIADKDTFRVGNEAPVMLVAPIAGPLRAVHGRGRRPLPLSPRPS